MDDMTPEQPQEPGQPTTRRKGFGTGLRLAAAGAATLAALPAGTAAADDDDWEDDWEDDWGASARARALAAREEALRFRTQLSAADPLYRVANVNGEDFNQGSDPGSRDPLARGAVRLVRDAPSVDPLIQVSLTGAVVNATYEVVFMGIRDNRVSLGWVRTNQSGNFEGVSRSNQDNTGNPGRLGGGNRVGVFVLTRNGLDQFVAALTTRIG
jgi:hypothetical protein